MSRIAEDLNLDVIQLHGDEVPADADALRMLTGCEIWKALHHHENTIQEIARFKVGVDGFVIDSSVKGQRGGTGVAFLGTVCRNISRRSRANVAYRRWRESGHHHRPIEMATDRN